MKKESIHLSPRAANNSTPATSRRVFFGRAAALAAGVAGGVSLAARTASAHVSNDAVRENQAWQARLEAARFERNLPVADHPTNGDESLFPNKIGNFSKGLPHNVRGEVDPGAWNSFIRALESGNPADFENIAISGGAKLVNPQAGLGFALQGPDSHGLTMKAPPAFSSADQAADIAENYWMAIVRDISFSDYPNHASIQQAADDLSRFSAFQGPTSGGRVTPATLFRGASQGDRTGPYISQFLWQDTPFGAERIDRRMRTAAGGVDYMTNYADWLSIQNGASPAPAFYDPSPRYIRNGRDLGEWAHIDVLFQAYFEALLILFRMGVPLDSGNPYRTSRSQIGFGTLGDPYIASTVCAVAREALKAVWFQKWFVHRRLRPEVFGGRIHNHMTGAARYPIHNEILNSAALSEVHRRHGTYLLPQAFPEGSPLHPSYGAGHATVAGACVTILKAFFDESYVIPNPVEAAPDGLSLVPYTGSALTVGGELNKLASNIAFGRNFGGIHWRSDATESLKLGEELAIRYLSEERACFNEPFDGYSLTKFDGTAVTV
jgi:hypothetical protein